MARKKAAKKKTTKKTARSRSAGRESTDLEAYVSTRGRAEQVRRVREKIKELGVTYIYYQFISVTGRIVGKGIPADHWERTAERGFQLVYGSTANLFVDRYGDSVSYTHLRAHET